MCLHGGFKTQTVVQLGNLLAALELGRIASRSVRIYFACLAATAAREAAGRTRIGKRQSSALYRLDELGTLCGLSQRAVRAELKRLERAGLLVYSESAIAFSGRILPGSEEAIAALACGRAAARPVPIPRPVIRYMARCPRIATIKTMIAYSVRGLSLGRTGEIRWKGTAKASWIAESLRLSIRSVRSARAELLAIEFITPDEGSKQWKLNRDGAYFTVNTSFTGRGTPTDEDTASTTRATDRPEIAPPPPQKCLESAPPYEDLKTPIGLKDQKSRLRGQHGFWNAEGRGGEDSPKLTDLRPIDLQKLSSLKQIFRQAIAAGWVKDGEADFLNWVAAAVRATRAQGDPVRIFVTIVRKQLWNHITAAQEDRARQVIDRDRNRQSRGLLGELKPSKQRGTGSCREIDTSRTAMPLSTSHLLARLTSQPLAGLWRQP